jgi:hypothetical protein
MKFFIYSKKWKSAGLFGFRKNKAVDSQICIHLAVRPACWKWGYAHTWNDGSWKQLGFGPFFLITWR